MKGGALVLLLALAAPAFGATRDDVAKGDVAKYNPDFPPQVVVEQINDWEIDSKAFILVEGALLVPDTLVVKTNVRVCRIEVVDEDEIVRLEPVAQIRLPEVLNLATLKEPGAELVRFEQRMWRTGLRLVLREYGKPGKVRAQYMAFRVTFETTGHVYRAAVTLYEARSSVEDRLDAASKRLGDIFDALRTLGEKTDKLGQTIRAAFDGVKNQVAALDKKLDGVEKQVEEASDEIAALSERVGSLTRRVRSLEKAD
jgi:prefoldin subunit 5